MYSSRSRERCTVEVERNQETDTQYHFTSLNRATNAFNQNKESSESECLRVIIKVWSNGIASIFTGQKSWHVD